MGKNVGDTAELLRRLKSARIARDEMKLSIVQRWQIGEAIAARCSKISGRIGVMKELAREEFGKMVLQSNCAISVQRKAVGAEGECCISTDDNRLSPVSESASCRTRTYDPVIKSHLLYQLS